MPADYTIDSARRSFSDLVDLTELTAIELTPEDLQYFGGAPLTARGVR
jgi:hypothetical protein